MRAVDARAEELANRFRRDVIGTLKTEIDGITRDAKIKPAQRLGRMLSVIRNKREDYSSLFDAAEYDTAKLVQLYSDARATCARQPKVVSNLSFGLIRLIRRMRMDWGAREHDETGAISRKKTIVITADSVDKSSFEHLKRELDGVTGGGSEISIQVLHMADDASRATATLQKKLDDYSSSDADIYDYMDINTRSFLARYLSDTALTKIVFGEVSHIAAIRESKKEPFYGPHQCLCDTASRILVPGEDQTKAYLCGAGGKGASGLTTAGVPGGGSGKAAQPEWWGRGETASTFSMHGVCCLSLWFSGSLCVLDYSPVVG